MRQPWINKVFFFLFFFFFFIDYLENRWKRLHIFGKKSCLDLNL